MATLAPQITAAGIISPSYADILQQLKIAYWSIYGSDANLDADTQDGQLLAVFAQAIYDCGQVAVAVYNSFSPSTAQGVGLSSVVKTNGIARQIPTYSTATVSIGGVVGTTITGGIITDNLGQGTRWDLPSSVTIPSGGTIDVTATNQSAGAIEAAPGTLTQILTPTRGWQTATNAVAATPGAAVETDATLRRRQAASTSLPSETPADALYAAVANLPGVSRAALIENDNDAADANGIPGHSMALVVLGGVVAEIAETIALKKAPGIGTAGTILTTVFDQQGVPNTIRFFPLTAVRISVEVTISPKPGYLATTGQLLVDTVAAFITAFDIGEDSYLNRLYSPANLGGTGLGATYVVTSIEQSRDGDPLAAVDIIMAFDEAAFAEADDITLVVVA